jgi:hypothetical protein
MKLQMEGRLRVSITLNVFGDFSLSLVCYYALSSLKVLFKQVLKSQSFEDGDSRSGAVK